METWKIIEIVLKKPIEQIVDVITGKWLCEPCKTKKIYFSKEAILNAALEKKNSSNK
ncbi:MAG: hypothetical protein ACRCX2_15595 [Paraclostridium sp.]